MYIFLFVFFFKQKTAYEMRISDWSSDVCSSDLLRRHLSGQAGQLYGRGGGGDRPRSGYGGGKTAYPPAQSLGNSAIRISYRPPSELTIGQSRLCHDAITPSSSKGMGFVAECWRRPAGYTEFRHRPLGAAGGRPRPQTRPHGQRAGGGR